MYGGNARSVSGARGIYGPDARSVSGGYRKSSIEQGRLVDSGFKTPEGEPIFVSVEDMTRALYASVR